MKIMKIMPIVVTLLTMSLLAFAAKKDTKPFIDDYAAWKNQPDEKFSDPEANFKKVKDMLLKQYFDSKLSEEDLYRAATQGMLAALNTDDHAWNKLLSPAELREMEGDLKGEITGIGIGMKFDSDTGITSVIDIIAGTAAEHAGLKVGDQIVSVNGRLYKGLQMRDVVYDIRGKVGEKIRLKILRGDDVVSKTVAREKISWSPVEWSAVSGNVGVLVIRYFSETTPELIRKGLAELEKKHLKGLVVDLRGNSGGLFTKAIEAAGLFVPKDTVVVNVVARDKSTEAIKSVGEPIIAAVPVVVITNRETASGAELFAANLVENLGAKLVGERTLGKWNAQDLEKLSNDFAVKFTIKQFKSPKGHSFQNVGLVPDIEVSGDDEVGVKRKQLNTDSKLRAAVNLLRG